MAKLNPQGLARRDANLMKCILPDDGWITVSLDFAAGEPTVTSEYSKDPNYYAACFGMVGKAPYWDSGILMISDIYLMVMSVSPIGAAAVKDAWAKSWPAGSFADQWLADSEVIKKALGEQRKIHKILALGLGYGMGSPKMVKQMYENGFQLDLKTAKTFRDNYWRLFRKVRALSDNLSLQIEKESWIVNQFGYRLTPEKRKAYNFYIQSSVSGLTNALCAKLFALTPWARFLAIIHDEILADIPIDRIEDFRAAVKLATDSLNADLGWSCEVRTGIVFGENWYAAK